MSSEIPVRPSGSGVPGWLVAVIAVLAIVVIVALFLFLTGWFDGDEAAAVPGIGPALAQIRDIA